MMKQPLAQFVMDSLLKRTAHARLDRVKDFVLNKLRLLLIRAGDPLVNYDLCGTQLVLPLSHNLPLIQKNYPHYSKNVARIARCVRRKYASLKFVDIGANIGDTVSLLRHYARYPVLCIEGSPEFFRILEINTLNMDEVYRSASFVGKADGRMEAALAYGHGTAHLTTGNSNLAMRSLGNILSDYREFENPKMIKVDTDGMDGLIIKGAMDVVARARPILFFEYDPHFFRQFGDDGLSLFVELRGLGYKVAMIYDNYGEYMLSFFLSENEILEDLHLYAFGRRGEKYYDICLFHEEDIDLARAVRSEEISFFAAFKRENHGNCS